MAASTDSVAGILDRIDGRAREQGQMTVGDATEALGTRAYGPLLFLPAIVELTPIGSIPGVPTLLAAIIGVFAAQMVLGRRRLWLPQVLERRQVSSERLHRAVTKLRPVGRRLDRWFHERWPGLTRGPAPRVAAAMAIGLCLATPPLEVIPFASSVPMGAIALLGLALTVHDGLLMVLAGVAAAAAAVAIPMMLLGL